MDGKDRRGSAGNREARREIFSAIFSERVRQHGRREIASETKQQITHRERGKAEMSGQQFSRKWLAGALGLALAFGVGGYAVARAKDAVSTTHVRASLKLADPNEAPSRTGFAPIVKEVLPNVVNISSSKVVRTPNQMPEGMQSDPFFQQFFGHSFGNRPEIPQNRREQSLGSGVIVSAQGYVLTNHHGVDG